jgi:uncharacterized membrane protein YbhN (UPF0104 family)
MAAAAVASWLVIGWYKRRTKLGQLRGNQLKAISFIALGTLLQIVVLCTIYGIELKHTGAHVSLGQIMSYSGVANFALFVALTPGAIGIRESFLLFSQGLHHLGSATIVAASVLDRATYLLFLGVLFVLVLSLHAKDKLRVKELTT